MPLGFRKAFKCLGCFSQFQSLSERAWKQNIKYDVEGGKVFVRALSMAGLKPGWSDDCTEKFL